MLKSFEGLVRRWPLAFFCILAFFLSWLAPVLATENAIFSILAVAGPTFAAMITILFLKGRPGLDELFRPLFAWQSGFIWFVIAILGHPGIALLSIGVLVAFGDTGFDFSSRLPWSLLPAILSAGCLSMSGRRSAGAGSLYRASRLATTRSPPASFLGFCGHYGICLFI